MNYKELYYLKAKDALEIVQEDLRKLKANGETISVFGERDYLTLECSWEQAEYLMQYHGYYFVPNDYQFVSVFDHMNLEFDGHLSKEDEEYIEERNARWRMKKDHHDFFPGEEEEEMFRRNVVLELMPLEEYEAIENIVDENFLEDTAFFEKQYLECPGLKTQNLQPWIDVHWYRGTENEKTSKVNTSLKSKKVYINFDDIEG